MNGAPGTSRKILFAIPSFGQGGAEQQIAMLIEGLSERGQTCEIFVLDGSGPLRPRLEAIGIPIHDMRLGQTSSRAGTAIKLLLAMIRLWWIALTKRPDVLHAFLPLANFMGAVAGRFAFVPMVITSRRALGTHQDRHPHWARFDHLANRFSSVVTVNSRAVGLDTIARDSISPAKLALIHNGLDMTRFDEAANDEGAIREELGLGSDEIGMVCVGNLIPYKGHSDLLDALALLPPDLPPYKLFIVGRDDGIGADLLQRAGDLGLADRFELLGPRQDVPRILKAMDLFIMPSHEEGFSNALLEAMAAGLVIVATDVGGNAEALDHGKYGSLVPARDPAALAEAVGKAIKDHDQKQDSARQAAAHIRQCFSVERMVDAHLALYAGQTSGASQFDWGR